jgi:hypothetical protein
MVEVCYYRFIIYKKNKKVAEKFGGYLEKLYICNENKNEMITT